LLVFLVIPDNHGPGNNNFRLPSRYIVESTVPGMRSNESKQWMPKTSFVTYPTAGPSKPTRGREYALLALEYSRAGQRTKLDPRLRHARIQSRESQPRRAHTRLYRSPAPTCVFFGFWSHRVGGSRSRRCIFKMAFIGILHRQPQRQRQLPTRPTSTVRAPRRPSPRRAAHPIHVIRFSDNRRPRSTVSSAIGISCKPPLHE
jgi:hypothetical protein